MGKSKKIERELPTIELSGIEFKVDAVNCMLIDAENTSNTIMIFEMRQLDDGHLEFVLDLEARKVKDTEWSDSEGGTHALIWLRDLAVYDTEGAKIILERHPALKPNNLPELEIAGEPFYLDVTRTCLMQVSNPLNRIHKMDLRHGFHFDTEKKWVLFPHELERMEAAGDLPSHVSFVDPETIRLKTKEALELHDKRKQPQKARRRIKN